MYCISMLIPITIPACIIQSQTYTLLHIRTSSLYSKLHIIQQSQRNISITFHFIQHRLRLRFSRTCSALRKSTAEWNHVCSAGRVTSRSFWRTLFLNICFRGFGGESGTCCFRFPLLTESTSYLAGKGWIQTECAWFGPWSEHVSVQGNKQKSKGAFLTPPL